MAAWRLLLPGRFRLLEHWCDFVGARAAQLRVINEDQWRQVGPVLSLVAIWRYRDSAMSSCAPRIVTPTKRVAVLR